jgi:hypothetical protein
LGGAAVSDYRVYFIGRDGHFLRAIDTMALTGGRLVSPKVSKK